MSSYISKEEMLGSFMPGLFTRRGLSKNLARLDPTSSKTFVGQIAKSMPGVGIAFTMAGAAGAALRSRTAAPPALAVPQVDVTSIPPSPSVPVDAQGQSIKKSSDALPIAVAATAGVLILALVFVVNK
jgi:hypothetical protein